MQLCDWICQVFLGIEIRQIVTKFVEVSYLKTLCFDCFLSYKKKICIWTINKNEENNILRKALEEKKVRNKLFGSRAKT